MSVSEKNFKFRCKHCNKKLKTPLSFVGEVIRCPHCNKALKIPDPSFVAPNFIVLTEPYVPPAKSPREIKAAETVVELNDATNELDLKGQFQHKIKPPVAPKNLSNKLKKPVRKILKRK
jgi:DNA-directed RNA polymerase subunit RPC12/RpoP